MLLALIFSLVALFVGLVIFRFYSPLYKSIFPIFLLSWAGHMIGSLAFSSISSDSSGYYFPFATSGTNGMFGISGSGYMLNVIWYVREWLTGDSYFATMFFFNILAFCGSVLWYCIFVKASDVLKLKDARLYQFPALIILCWPSFLFFTAGFKDAWSFFFIPLFILAIISVQYSRYKLISFIVLLFSGGMACIIRSYLAMVFFGALYLSSLMNRRLKYYVKILGAVAFLIMFIITAHFVLATTFVPDGNSSLHVVSQNYNAIAAQAVLQQDSLNTGTSFPMPTHNPALILLILPYAFIMNLCFPLFILASNFQGILASFENLFLVYLIYFAFKNRKFIPEHMRHLMFMRMLFFFFIVGMCFMALINTNLGLATREKSMYLPAFLIFVSIIYVQRKQLQYDSQKT